MRYTRRRSRGVGRSFLFAAFLTNGFALAGVAAAQGFPGDPGDDASVNGAGCATPVLTMADVSVPEGDSGETVALFTAMVTNPNTACSATFDLSTRDDSAEVADGDYEAAEATWVFNGGASATFEFPVTVNGDTRIEPDETFFVDLVEVFDPIPIGGTAGTPRPLGLGGIELTAEGEIRNDDFPTVSIDDVQVEEGDSGTTNAVFTVRAEPSLESGILVGFETVDGTATVGDNDYQPQEGGVTIEAVAPFEATITVPVVGDTKIEDDETFIVRLTGVKGNAEIADGEGVGTILNDEGEPSVSIDDVEVVEGDSGQTAAVFTINVSPLSRDVQVDFATEDQTATTEDGDYAATSGSLQFAFEGSPTQTISVPVNGDTRVEPDETFLVRIISVDGGAVVKGEGVGTIVSDDVTSMVRIAAAPPVVESAGTASVVVERVDPSGDPARVTVNAGEGTATAGVDFQPITAIVSWGADEGGPRTVQIPLLDDSLAEGDETVRVTLSAPENATLGSPSTADLRILDDEQEGEIEIVGDGEPRGVVDREAELAVRVRSLGGAPIEGARVFWTADDETVEFTSGNPTSSGADGVSRQTVQLGGRPRIVIVSATLDPSAAAAPGAQGGAAAQQEEVSVEFRLRVRGDLDLASDADVDPENLSVGGVLDFACIEPQGDFADFCGYLFGLGDGDQQQVVQEATPREVAAQGNLMLDLPQWSFRHVGRRLAALRGGGSRRAEEELALVFGREEVKVAALVDTVRDAVARQARFDGAVSEALEAVSGSAQEGAGTGAGEEPQPRMDEELDALPRLGVFASGRVATAERDGTDREEGFEAGIEGLTVGADYRLTGDLILGGAVGYLTTDLDLLNDGGGLDADGYSLTAYGAWMREALYVEGVVGYGSTSFDLRRHVDLPVPFQGATRFVALGETDGTQWMANLGTGWEIAAGASSVELFGRASYVDAELDGYRERGGGPFDLEIRDQTLDSLLAEAGVSFGHAISRDWGVLQPVVRAAALHEFGDDSRLIRGSFLGDVQQLEFLVPTEEPDRDFFNLGVGVTVTTYRGRSFYLFYDTDLARDDLEIGTFTLGARLEF